MPPPECCHELDVYGDHILPCKYSVLLGNSPLVWSHDALLRFLAADLRRVVRHLQIKYRVPLAHKYLPDIKCLGEQGGAKYIELSIDQFLSCSDRMRVI